MNRLTLFLVLSSLGCVGRAESPEEQGEGDERLTGESPRAAPTAAAEIAYIEVDESSAPVPRKIRVDASCRVTDHTHLDALADSDRCKELFAIATDTTAQSCGPYGGVGAVTVHMNDGRTLVRDLAADRCSVTVPSLPTHKGVYAAWYSAGGK